MSKNTPDSKNDNDNSNSNTNNLIYNSRSVGERPEQPLKRTHNTQYQQLTITSTDKQNK